MDEISNVHDAYFISRLFGVVELKSSGGNSTLSVGNVRVPLPASEIVGWTTAVLAAILMVGAVCVAVRGFKTYSRTNIKE